MLDKTLEFAEQELDRVRETIDSLVVAEIYAVLTEWEQRFSLKFKVSLMHCMLDVFIWINGSWERVCPYTYNIRVGPEYDEVRGEVEKLSSAWAALEWRVMPSDRDEYITSS